jgi:AraC family ethanolamine operon transcriptional activator
MRGHADEAISVPELCAATGVSRRALQYAFEDVLHLSPVTYLRAMRLNRVRAELLAGCADSVGDIAARWGFWHLSRFAAEYRELFGELPSATRTRAATARPGPPRPA